jgi:hypothetical protein
MCSMAMRSPGQCHADARTGQNGLYDFQPEGDPEQAQLALHLLERRYELGLAGTFLTTNLLAHDHGGGDEMLGSRLIRLCAETSMTVDFSESNDWWQNVKSRASKCWRTNSLAEL